MRLIFELERLRRIKISLNVENGDEYKVLIFKKNLFLLHIVTFNEE